MNQELVDELHMASLERYMAYMLDNENWAYAVGGFFENLASQYKALSDLRGIKTQMMSAYRHDATELQILERMNVQIGSVMNKIAQMERINGELLQRKASEAYMALWNSLRELYLARTERAVEQLEAAEKIARRKVTDDL